jgi:hypothetical protein
MVDAVTNYNTSFLGGAIASGGNADALKTTGLPVTVSTSAPPTPGQALVATSPTSAEWTDISVPLVDNLTFITDAGVPSNRIGFDATGSGNTTLTLRSQTTGNRTVTFPDNTDTLVARNTVDTLTNKTLTNPIISNIINGPGSNITLPPNQVTQLVGRNTLDTLTNKTIAGNTNFVAANSLKANTAGTSLINVESGTPPPGAGYVLRTVSNVRADWQPETVTTLSNQGTSSLLFTGTGPNLAIKGLLAGNGVNITPLANDLQLTADYSNVVDANLTIVDSVNATRTLKFDVNGSLSTLTTLATTSSANRTIQLPDISDVLVTRTNNETLTNKSVIDDTFNIRDNADNSIRLTFDASGITNTSTQIRAVQSANRVVELPDQSTELIGDDSIHTLTNKTIIGATNTVEASHLRTLSGAISVNTTNPSANQVLTYNGVNAVWQDNASANPSTLGTGSTIIADAANNRYKTLTAGSGVSFNATANDIAISAVGGNLVDNTTFIVDSVDATKRIGFDAAGTTGTTTTLLSTQTANRVLQLPDISDTLITTASTNSISNKTLVDASNRIASGADPTKQLAFQLAGSTTGITTTLATSSTVARVLTLPDATDTLIGRTTTDTLTNKNLSDTTTFIVDATTPTIRIGFNAAGTAATTTTLTSSQTANRVITLPDVTDTLVARTTTDTLTNKNLSDTTTFIVDATTPTIRIGFNAAGTAATTTTLTSSQTANRVITLPDVTDTIIARTTADTLTNKTIIDVTNNVAANSLKTTGASVDIAASAPPSVGQVLKATSATTAVWSNDNNTATTLASAGGAQTLIASTSAYPNFTVKSLAAGDYMAIDTFVTDQLRISSYDGVFTAIKTVSDTQDLYTLHGKQKNYHIVNNNASPINVILPTITSSAVPDPVLIRIGNDICVSLSSGSLNVIDILNPADSSVLLRLYPGSCCRFITRALGASGYILTSVHGSFLGNSSNNIILGTPTITAASTNTVSLKTAGTGISGLNSCVAIGANALDNSASTGNVAIGVSALQVNQTANNNTAIGHQCGANLLSGVQQSNAVAIGYRSCYNSPFGAGSVSIGAFTTQSGSSNSSVVIGNTSSRDNVPGTFSVIIGANQNVSTSSGPNTIMVGSDNISSHSNVIALGTGIISNNAFDILVGNSITPAGTNGRSLFLQASGLGLIPSGSIIAGIANTYPTSTTPDDIIIIGKSNSIANQPPLNGGQMLLVGRSNTVGTSLIINTNINIFGSSNIIDNTILGDISIFGSGNTCNSQSGSPTIVAGVNNTNVFGSNVIFGISNISQASSQFCVALGRSNTVSTLGTNTFPSIAVGTSCIASSNGGGSLAVGYQSNSSAPRSVALGFGAEAKTICANLPVPLSVKPSGAILQSDAHYQFGSAVCSYSTTNITAVGTYDFTIGTDSQLLFCPFSIMVVNTGAGTGNMTFSLGTPADVTLYRIGVTVGTLTAYQMWSEEMTNAKRQNARAVGVTGNTTLRVNVTAWSTTLAPFLPRVTIIGHAYQL